MQYFFFLREWLKKNTGYKSLKGEHTKLPNFIKKNGPFKRDKNSEIYDDLIHLKKLRHQADYRLTVPSKYSKDYKKNGNSQVLSRLLKLRKALLKLSMDFKLFFLNH